MDATLANLVDALDPLLAAPNIDQRWRADAAGRVGAFRGAWARYHADSEHEGGIYHELTAAEPRVAARVRRLRCESLELIELADEALSVMSRDGTSDADVRVAITTLALHARRYRSREATATHEAVAVDLGSG